MAGSKHRTKYEDLAWDLCLDLVKHQFKLANQAPKEVPFSAIERIHAAVLKLERAKDALSQELLALDHARGWHEEGFKGCMTCEYERTYGVGIHVVHTMDASDDHCVADDEFKNFRDAREHVLSCQEDEPYAGIEYYYVITTPARKKVIFMVNGGIDVQDVKEDVHDLSP